MMIPSPKVAIDPGARVVKIEQPHPFLVDTTQTVVITWPQWKMITSKILAMEARSEVAAQAQASQNGQGETLT
jgi:hypothetical protein